MPIKEADMNNCKPKRRPLIGPNEGVAYDPDDPCPSGYSWDEELQDCVLPDP